MNLFNGGKILCNNVLSREVKTDNIDTLHHIYTPSE